MSWNLNGLNEELKRLAIRMQRKWKAHVMLIQETKRGVITRRLLALYISHHPEGTEKWCVYGTRK